MSEQDIVEGLISAPRREEKETRWFAVQSRSGSHIGLWANEDYAKDAAAEKPDNYVIMELADVAEIDRLRTALAAEKEAREKAEAECEVVCNSYVIENQRLHDRATEAEAKLEKAKEALGRIHEETRHAQADGQDGTRAHWLAKEALAALGDD